MEATYGSTRKWVFGSPYEVGHAHSVCVLKATKSTNPAYTERVEGWAADVKMLEALSALASDIKEMRHELDALLPKKEEKT